MPETGKLQRSWLLFNTSLKVLLQNRKLLLFPLVSSLAIAVMILFFAAPIIFMPTGHSILEVDHWNAVEQKIFGSSPTKAVTDGLAAIDRNDDANIEIQFDFNPKRGWLIYLAFGYLASMFVATFSNVAFANEILNGLNGRAVSVKSGFRFAWSRVSSILVWSLFAGVIGFIIQSLEQHFGWIGKIILNLVGVVWSVASVFVIPTIVREGSTNPAELLRKSAGTLRKTWGEMLIGYVGIGLVTIAIVMATLVCAIVVLIPAFAFHLWGVAIAVVLVWVITAIALAYITGVAEKIYQCALYIYASEGVAPGPYSPEMMDMAWKVK
jgi:hypothetical protein